VGGSIPSLGTLKIKGLSQIGLTPFSLLAVFVHHLYIVFGCRVKIIHGQNRTRRKLQAVFDPVPGSGADHPSNLPPWPGRSWPVRLVVALDSPASARPMIPAFSDLYLLIFEGSTQDKKQIPFVLSLLLSASSACQYKAHALKTSPCATGCTLSQPGWSDPRISSDSML
jgi:hypothetical protein